MNGRSCGFLSVAVLATLDHVDWWNGLVDL